MMKISMKKIIYDVKIKRGLFEEEVRAEFEKDCFQTVHHFELFGKATSETGYHSLFVMKDEMVGKSPEEFLKENLEVDFGKGNVEVKKHNENSVCSVQCSLSAA